MSSALVGPFGAAGLAADQDINLTGENLITPPAATTLRNLIGQPAGTTQAGLFIEPAANITSGARYYTLVVQATSQQAGTGSDGHIVPIYSAANALTNGGYVWSLNTLVRVANTMTSGEVVGYELDVNNYGADSLTPASALKVWGMTVSGDGTNDFRRISAWSLQGPASGWNYGLTFYNNALNGGAAYIYTADTTFPAVGIDFSSAEFGTAAIKLKTTGKIDWNGDTVLYRSAANTLATDDDLEVTLNARGLILKSPDGTRYRVSVANGGALSAAAA